MKYLDSPVFQVLLKDATAYQKTSLTALRKPAPEDVGRPVVTMVSVNMKTGEYRQEAVSEIAKDSIVAKNLEVIGKDGAGKDVYNMWVMSRETAEKNYGKDVVAGLSTEVFTSHMKKAVVRAVELTPELMSKLGLRGQTMSIDVSWSKEHMLAKVGDFLTDKGYSISKKDMLDYVPVKNEPVSLSVKSKAVIKKPNRP